MLRKIPTSHLSHGLQFTSLTTWFTSLQRNALPATPIILPGSNRQLHTTAPISALGVVDLLHDEVAIALPAGSSRRFWEVVEFRPDATALETWKTPEVLGLHPRDVHLFTSDTGMGHRAMIAPRSGAILFRTEAAKAVVYADKAVLFPARRLQDTVRVAQAIKSALAQRSALPFELKVLESLLSETAQTFDKKTKRLGMVAETVMEDINRNFHASAAELQRSLPIARKLTEVQHDVKETLDAIGDVANYDDQLQALCLTERAKAIAAVTQKGAQASTAAATAAAAASSETPKGQSDTPKTSDTSTTSHFDEETLHRRPHYRTSSSATTSPSSTLESHFSGADDDGNNSGGSTRSMSTNATSFEAGSYFASEQQNRENSSNTNGHRGVNPTSASSPAWGSPLLSHSSGVAPPVVALRSPHMRMASRILEAYEFRMMGTHGALNEMLENMEQTRTVWHMQLDHQRNRVLRINLLISIASFCGLMSTIPAAYFGMNLDSGLEDLPGLFWPVVQGSIATGLFCGSLVYLYYKFGPKRRYAARLRDMRSLRDLLSYHMDDLDAIIDAVRVKGSLTKREFTDVVTAAVRGKPMSNEEVALLFRVFDANKDAVLELSELMKLEELHDTLWEDQLAHHTS